MEVWKPIPGYEFYEASSLGKIRSIDRRSAAKRGETKYFRLKKGRVLKQTASDCGYFNVHLCEYSNKKIRYVHHLIAEAFIGKRPKGLVVNHINGIKSDNRSENLEYVSYKENFAHAVKIGIYKDRHLSPEDINTIKFFFSEKGKRNGVNKILAKIYKRTLSTIYTAVKSNVI